MEMLDHPDEVMRQYGEKCTLQHHDGKEEDNGEVSLMSYDIESNRVGRTTESSWDGGYKRSQRRMHGEEALDPMADNEGQKVDKRLSMLPPRPTSTKMD